MFSDPFFRFFFDPPGTGRGEPRRREQSLGSGVIVSSDGVIVTNNHVVEDAAEVRVALKDGRTVRVDVVRDGKQRSFEVTLGEMPDAARRVDGIG